ncbi:uncharacterized protein LOC128253159 [Drosophila gunungcola]|uniref:Myb/SANT-like DNA-binding domain-containing protein n=1 Tax=Drosophila gunungcola TaxID=103775 RepID=A0A9Q0BNP9_9MUSC|nr:uncharacterized protein LOC128253159 [Drosophila gunungcola]KAI8038179.1 hypothetical protein M5D96_008868 [Drosophila gunungcola]
MSGQKHLRLRYYTSLEEALLVRLWREHLHNIPSYTENLPIFREIAHGLQQHGVRLNKQEVRRRINSYRNKYLNERKRVESNAEHLSDWRLYALIDSLFRPDRPAADLCHAHHVLEQADARARADLPALPPLRHTASAPAKFERDPDGSAFLDAQPLGLPVVKAEPAQAAYHQVKSEPKPTEAELGDAYADSAIIRRTPLTPANHLLPDAEDATYAGHANGQPEAERSAAKRRRGRRSILPRTGQITMAIVEGLRQENRMLEEQNDACLLALEQKEKQFLAMEQNFLTYLERQEALLAHMQQRGIKQEPDRDF